MKKFISLLVFTSFFISCFQDDDFLDEIYFESIDNQSNDYWQKEPQESKDTIFILNDPKPEDEGDPDDTRVKDGDAGKKHIKRNFQAFKR